MTTKKSGKLGAADYEIEIEPNGNATVRVCRDYSGKEPLKIAPRVWQIVANFGGVKTIFPSLLSVNLTYPDDTDATTNTVRYMTFAPSDPGKPISSNNPLPLGVEQLIQLDEASRQLTYISVLGLPVTNYRSIMQVTDDGQCRLTWTS